MTKTQVMIAARLYEARDCAKSLLGDKYPERIRQAREALRGLAAKHDTTVLNAALNLAKKLAETEDAYTQMIVFAAVVDEIEGAA
jgi:hypothetical protein